MNIPFVDLRSQYDSIKNEIDSAIKDVISKSAFVGGPFFESFQKSFAFFCGVKHCIGVGNGMECLTGLDHAKKAVKVLSAVNP